MRMRMSLLQDAIRAGNGAQSLKYFRDIQESLGEAHAGLRQLITHFRLPMDRQGLVHALESTARTFRDRTGVELRIENRARDLRLPAEQEAQVYQIVREALANVIKHAGASSARVVLERTARSLRVSVEDDGSRRLHRAPPRRRRQRRALRPRDHARARPAHRGAAAHRERPGQGHAGLPLHPAVPGTTDRTMSDTPIRVVLIDDHGLCRRGLAELLEHRAGIRVVGATGEPDAAAEAAQASSSPTS